jgi:hypothetical protein
VGFDELLGLHKHAAGAAAGVVDLAAVGRQHRHQGLDDAGGRIELAALLALGAGELPEEVLVDLTQHIPRLGLILTKADGGDEINELAELAIGQRRAGVPLVENAFKPRVFRLDGCQGVIDALADIRLLGGGAQGFPTGAPAPRRRSPLCSSRGLRVRRLSLGAGIQQAVIVVLVGKAASQFGAAGGKGVGDKLQEDQAENQVLVFGGIDVGAQLVGGGPESFFDIGEHERCNLE